MFSGPRLDPFSARLLAIHQKGKREPSTGAVGDALTDIAKEQVGPEAEHTEAETGQAAHSSPDSNIALLEVEERTPERTPEHAPEHAPERNLECDPELGGAMGAHMQWQETVDTGCAECGGMGKKSDPVEELRAEMTAIKARLAELEEAVAALEMP